MSLVVPKEESSISDTRLPVRGEDETGGRRAHHHEGGSVEADVEVDCKEVVPRPMDSAPIRSPQEIHSAIVRKIRGKRLVEIGTRNGDGMSCFARYTSSATAIEYAADYCRELESRAASEGWGHDFDVQCEDFNLADLDGDYVTWWQQKPLTNRAALKRLRRLQCSGGVREGAEAILVFDEKKLDTDVRDLEYFDGLSAFEWRERMPFDERELCEAQAAASSSDPGQCERAEGWFVAAGLPVSRVPQALSGCDAGCRCKPDWVDNVRWGVLRVGGRVGGGSSAGGVLLVLAMLGVCGALIRWLTNRARGVTKPGVVNRKDVSV